MKSIADVFRKDEMTKMVNGVEPRCSFLALLYLSYVDPTIMSGGTPEWLDWQIDRSGRVTVWWRLGVRLGQPSEQS